MTDTTPEARQMAADLVNAETSAFDWRAEDFEAGNAKPSARALARLCARFIAMQEDWAEVFKIAYAVTGDEFGRMPKRLDLIVAIAAKYRAEADPLDRLREWAKQHSDVTPLDGTDRNSPTFGDLRALIGKAKP